MYYYIYRLTCTHPDFEKGPKYYYGFRSSHVLPEHDTKYVSSSKLVKQTRDLIGKHWFRKKIVFQYPTKQQALAKEIFLHAFFNVKDHSLFFNLANQTSTRFITSKELSESQKQKLREKATGKHHSLESKKKMSEFRRGKKRKPLSEEHREKIRQTLLKKGFSPSLETRKKMSESKKNKTTLHGESTKKKISDKMIAFYAGSRAQNQRHTCTWCGKTGRQPGVFVWHFQNCKMRPK